MFLQTIMLLGKVSLVKTAQNWTNSLAIWSHRVQTSFFCGLKLPTILSLIKMGLSTELHKIRASQFWSQRKAWHKPQAWEKILFIIIPVKTIPSGVICFHLQTCTNIISHLLSERTIFWQFSLQTCRKNNLTVYLGT